jgi:ABC-type dipeptide/oligopeptide/nickel transport system permease subunit
MTAVAPEATLEAPVEVAITGKTPWQLFWTRFKKDKAAFVGAALVGILALLALMAPLIADYIVGHGPNELFSRRMTDEFGLPKGPNNDFWFGADQAGRDVFVRTIYGAQTSMLVALGATGIAVFFGVVLGMTAGYLGGKIDTFISRVMDVMLSMPVLLFAIGIAAACGADVVGCLGGAIKPGRLLVVLVIALFTWPYIGRIVRGNTLSIKEKEFIEAARSVGAGNTRIMFREVLPNLVAPIIVYSSLFIPANILLEAALSFLGVGVQPPTASWGEMLSEAVSNFDTAWWFMLYPGLALLLTVLAFNLVGDGLQDALNPKGTQSR